MIFSSLSEVNWLSEPAVQPVFRSQICHLRRFFCRSNSPCVTACKPSASRRSEVEAPCWQLTVGGAERDECNVSAAGWGSSVIKQAGCWRTCLLLRGWNSSDFLSTCSSHSSRMTPQTISDTRTWERLFQGSFWFLVQLLLGDRPPSPPQGVWRIHM